MHIGRPIRTPAGGKPGEVAYRMFTLGGESRRIVSSHEFFAADDESAIRIAEASRDGRKIELWQRARVVKIWD